MMLVITEAPTVNTRTLDVLSLLLGCVLLVTTKKKGGHPVSWRKENQYLLTNTITFRYITTRKSNSQHHLRLSVSFWLHLHDSYDLCPYASKCENMLLQPLRAKVFKWTHFGLVAAPGCGFFQISMSSQAWHLSSSVPRTPQTITRTPT